MERPSQPSGVAPDLTERVLDGIDALVGLVRDRAIKPLTLAARILVYGAIVAFSLITVAVLSAVGFVRLLNAYAFSDWLSLVVVGGIFAGAGLFLLSRARPARQTR
jgi:hypothetical protein